jgi:preprotein translocase subunit YajC
MNSWNFLNNVASGFFYLGVLYLLYYISNKRQQAWNKLSANNKIQSSMNTKYFVIFSLIIAIVVFIVLLIMDKNKKQQKRRKLK